MARASMPTGLALDRFAQIAGVHPLHFNQITVGTFPDDTAPDQFCNVAIMQHSWQSSGGVSRESVATAIAEAELEIENFLGYSLVPKHFVEVHQAIRHHRVDSLPNHVLVNLRSKLALSGGIRSTSVIELGATITYEDIDGDDFEELATVISTVALGTLVGEIRVYYPDKLADPAWEIRPVKSSIDGTVLSITFGRHQAVTELVQESFTARAVDGTESDNFLETVDIYRIYNDPSDQAILYSAPGCAGCTGSGCTSCEYSSNNGCIKVINSRMSQVAVHPGTWDVDHYVLDSCCIGWPSKVEVKYLAGAVLDSDYKMQNKYELAVTRLAMSRLDRPLCGCPSVQGNFDYWVTDLAQNNSETSRTPSNNVVLDCPFGTQRGAVWAWNLLRVRERIV